MSIRPPGNGPDAPNNFRRNKPMHDTAKKGRKAMPKTERDWSEAPPANAEFEDVTSDFVKFDEIDKAIEGFLIAKGSQTMRNGIVGKYEIERPDGAGIVSFHGTNDLDDKLARLDVGDYVRITYTGDTKTAAGQMMKQFRVQRRTN